MATCYRPDGTVASDQFACWNTTGSDNHAPCCMNSSYCYSNGWCSDPAHMTAFRAGCTDRLWQSDQCVQRCLGGPIGGAYKCDDDGGTGCFKADCGTAKEFTIRPGSLLLSGPAAAKALNASLYATITSSPEASQDLQFSSSALAGVGVGVGAPLLIALLAALFFLFRERKKNRSSHQKPPFSTKNELAVGTHSDKGPLQYQSILGSTRHELDMQYTRTELPP